MNNIITEGHLDIINNIDTMVVNYFKPDCHLYTFYFAIGTIENYFDMRNSLYCLNKLFIVTFNYSCDYKSALL